MIKNQHRLDREFHRLHTDAIYKYTLRPEFVEQFIGRQPKWGTLGYITYKRTYARRIPDENRTEEFWETLQRVVEGCFSLQKTHCLKLGLPWYEDKAHRSAEKMYQKMWDFKFSASGRGLWIMGTPFVDEHGTMALNNCGFCSTEDIDIRGSMPFEWTMDALMLGVGVGFDTKGADKILIKHPYITDEVFTIPDSREGWVESVGILLNAFFYGKDLPRMDYSIIRPYGTPIKGFGGVASGHEPLKQLHESIQKLLTTRVGKLLTSVNIVDIFNLIGKCVIAGNVRRSAEIGLGDINDDEFITMKEDQEKLIEHRWVSNNSVIAKVGDDYTKIISSIQKNGEPSVLWLENAQNYSRMDGKPDYKDINAKGVNPCGEQTLESYELCNLVETFPSHHDSYEEFEETLKYAYLFAKSVTLENTHWTHTNAVMGKNRRIGTSMSGIIDAFVKHGRRTILEWCDKGYTYLRKLDNIYSDWLCIPKSIKITSVKPSGTVSLLAGVSSGIHYPHSEYYIRRIRLAFDSPLLLPLEIAGHRIEKDKYSDNTVVVEFSIHEEYFTRSKNDVTIWEQFQNASDLQRHWSDNQVSITVTFKPEEKGDILHALQCYEDKLKSVSLLPLSDHGFEQAPYETISEVEYDEMVKNIQPVFLESVDMDAKGVDGCSTDVCELKHELADIEVK